MQDVPAVQDSVYLRRLFRCRFPRYDTLAFLLLHAGYVSQWAFDYRFYQSRGLSLRDVSLVVAVQQAALVLGRVLPLARLGCASHAIWTLVALQVDVLRFDIGTVYQTAAGCYAAAVVCLLLVGRSGRRRCCSSFAKRAFEKRQTTESSDEEDDDSDSSSSFRHASPSPRFYGQSLNARLVWLTFYSESTSRVAMSVSSVSIQTTAILARVAFPAVVEIPCFQYVSSLPVLLVARLSLEQLAACQAVRWPQPCGRWMFLFSGYTVCSVVLLLHFQTYIHQEDLCALHMMLAYSVSMSSAAGAARPAWETHLAGVRDLHQLGGNLPPGRSVWPPQGVCHWDGGGALPRCCGDRLAGPEPETGCPRGRGLLATAILLWPCDVPDEEFAVKKVWMSDLACVAFSLVVTGTVLAYWCPVRRARIEDAPS